MKTFNVARKDYNTAACAHTSFTFIDIDRLKPDSIRFKMERVVPAMKIFVHLNLNPKMS